MLANIVDELLALERMADIRREVAEAQLVASLRDKPAKAAPSRPQTLGPVVTRASILAEDVEGRAA